MTPIQERLFALQDLSYRAFQSKLMPTVDPSRVIGVRMPALRRLAKEIAAEPQTVAEFLALPEHEYYEENNLHGLLINGMKDFEECIAALDEFLPYVDNWATCDLLKPRSFKKEVGGRDRCVLSGQSNESGDDVKISKADGFGIGIEAKTDIVEDRLLPHVRRWLASEHVYTCRFGVGVLMNYYLDEAFEPRFLEWVGAIRSDEYYVNMGIAWYFATALAKQWEEAVKWVEKGRLETWVHNRSIQKSVESYRVGEEQKEYLKKLKK